MIINTQAIRVDHRKGFGNVDHLLNQTSNKAVIERLDMDRHAPREIAQFVDDAEDIAILSNSDPARRHLLHVKISPDHLMTDDQWQEILAGYEAEFGIPPTTPRKVVIHSKGERADHIHVLYYLYDPLTGRAIKTQNDHQNDEFLGRFFELKFGEKLLSGKHHDYCIRAFLNRGLLQEAGVLQKIAPAKGEKSKVPPQLYKSKSKIEDAIWLAWQTASQAPKDFKIALEKIGLSVVVGDKKTKSGEDRSALIAFDATTGAYESILNVLRRKSKASGQPLKIRKNEFIEKLGPLPSIEFAKTLGLDQLLRKSRRSVEMERTLLNHFTTNAEEMIFKSEIQNWEATKRKRRLVPDRFMARERSILQIPAVAESSQSIDRTQRSGGKKPNTLEAKRAEILQNHQTAYQLRQLAIQRAMRQNKIWKSKSLSRMLRVAAFGGVMLTSGHVLLALGATYYMGRLIAAQRNRSRQNLQNIFQQNMPISRTPAKACPPKFHFDLNSITKGQRIAAGYLFLAAQQGRLAEQRVVKLRAHLNGLKPGLGDQIVRAQEEGSPGLKAIFAKMYDPSKSAHRSHIANLVEPDQRDIESKPKQHLDILVRGILPYQDRTKGVPAQDVTEFGREIQNMLLARKRDEDADALDIVKRLKGKPVTDSNSANSLTQAMFNISRAKDLAEIAKITKAKIVEKSIPSISS